MHMSAAGAKGEDRGRMVRSEARKVVVRKARLRRQHTLAGGCGLAKRCQFFSEKDMQKVDKTY
jgi:hypothetical protein